MKYDRQSQIKQLFQEKKRITIKELCDTFGISAETARRDLNELGRDGTIRRIYCGAVKKDDMITTGFLANDFLKHFSHIDVTVLSADGFNGNIGLTDYNVEMGTLKEAMVQKSSQVFVGADHSKFLTSGFYKVCGIHDLSLVVTDVGASQASLEALREAGVEVVVVDP